MWLGDNGSKNYAMYRSGRNAPVTIKDMTQLTGEMHAVRKSWPDMKMPGTECGGKHRHTMSSQSSHHQHLFQASGN